VPGLATAIALAPVEHIVMIREVSNHQDRHTIGNLEHKHNDEKVAQNKHNDEKVAQNKHNDEKVAQNKHNDEKVAQNKHNDEKVAQNFRLSKDLPVQPA
jgi:hypothetical protein